ncbi:MAG: Transcriptional regulator containing HTH domain ArsR family [Candidatus Methanohalarchaeum thermophilum]|uniref:Transcriptional regulator containing HTH domain ArsR family n=1 Tax=Methanohalarchaeum thermophilum TaxID=1903181 RepID=A0A1Q6DTU9_METT1|nr:MAG: Transcriptional regulator containing HTH domain ArsR family [Candidatus Methanohalarchaeum thermophilum]
MKYSDSVDLVRRIGNKYNAEILSEIKEEKAVREFLESLDIPVATSYRRFDELSEFGLIEEVCKILSKNGGDVWLYRSKVSRITIYFDGAGVDVELVKNSREEDNLVGLWLDLR